MGTIADIIQDAGHVAGEENAEKTDTVDSSEVLPLTDVTNNKVDADASDKNKKGPARERRERGPPADGIPSKNKVMVANLPYDLTEETVRSRAPYTLQCKCLEVLT
jgi:hypothetical protein